MKSILAVFCLLHTIWYAQCINTAIQTATDQCIEEGGFDKDAIMDALKEETLPEDNDDLTTVYKCVWKALEILDSDGELDKEKLTATITTMRQNRLNNEEDEEASLKVAEDAIAHCEDTLPNAIAHFNCIKKYSKNHI